MHKLKDNLFTLFEILKKIQINLSIKKKENLSLEKELFV